MSSKQVLGLIALMLLPHASHCAPTNESSTAKTSWPKFEKPLMLDITWKHTKESGTNTTFFTIHYPDRKTNLSVPIQFADLESLKRFIGTLPPGARIVFGSPLQAKANWPDPRPDFKALGIYEACKTRGIKFGYLAIY